MKEDEKIIAAVKNIPIEQIKQLDYFKNRGRYFIQRALINDKVGHRELAFSDAIKRHHEISNDAIRHIVGDDDKAVEAAFTLFQWLTTNVGSAVLEDALRSIGKRIVNIES